MVIVKEMIKQYMILAFLRVCVYVYMCVFLLKRTALSGGGTDGTDLLLPRELSSIVGSGEPFNFLKKTIF